MVTAESKHGTTTVSIVCKDAIIIAADKRASMGYLIANKETDKIFKISDQIAMTIAGSAGDGQMLAKYLKAEVDLYRLNINMEPSLDIASNLMQNILFQQGKSWAPYLVQLIIAGLDDKGNYAIYTLDPMGSSIKETRYYTTGSGSPMVFGLLEDSYRENMSEDEAVQLAVRGITSAVRRDMGSGEGIDVIIINKKGFRRLDKIPIDTVVKKK
ncbi:MAG: proteasome subunit beta [DPANN group archaeon]|nr:proteasome subunit beta [DPANN group archaeon]